MELREKQGGSLLSILGQRFALPVSWIPECKSKKFLIAKTVNITSNIILGEKKKKGKHTSHLLLDSIIFHCTFITVCPSLIPSLS